MSNLLELVVQAHGGLARWRTAEKLTAQVSIGGGLWPAKGQADVLNDVEVTIDCHHQHVEYSPFGAADMHSVYEPGRTAVMRADGSTAKTRINPREAFKSHVRETQWDDLDLAYFSGYAMWTYLTTPYLFLMPEVQSEEIEPWDENGETWRRLKVIFPDHIATHSREQTFYFNAAGILTRHDYNADVLGGLPSANYATEPKEFSGFIFPTKRRVFARQPDGHPVRSRLAVSIDIHDIAVR